MRPSPPSGARAAVIPQLRRGGGLYGRRGGGAAAPLLPKNLFPLPRHALRDSDRPLEAGGGGRVSGPFLGHSMSGEQIVRHGRFVHTLLAEGLPLQEISSPFPAMSR